MAAPRNPKPKRRHSESPPETSKSGEWGDTVMRLLDVASREAHKLDQADMEQAFDAAKAKVGSLYPRA